MTTKLANKIQQRNIDKSQTKLLKEENGSTSFFDLRTTQGQLLFLFITIALSSLIQLLPNGSIKSAFNLIHERQVCSQPTVTISSPKKPIYWIYGKSKNQDHLKHVHLVFKRLGFEYGTNQSDWDVLWAHDYPFTALYPMLQKHLKSHQRVNHFPGCGFITNKVDFATTISMKYIPKAFQLPKDKDAFNEYARKYPQKLFVQKHNQHRYIYVRNLTEIDFNDSETFLQEYIDRPFLVDGHKFDIGIYVIITSIDPLRVYIYTGDVLFRYCPTKYYPFDRKTLDKYVVGDDYLPTWEVPSLTKYYSGLGFSMKDSFDAYVRSLNRDPNMIWQQAEDAIRSSILQQEHHMAAILNKLGSKRNFFELMRFDLVIDADFNVYLLEANMSPNLSSAHFKQNTLLYEQVIYNMFNLVGVGSTITRESLRKRSIDEESMISSDKNIVVFANKCSSSTCAESCNSSEWCDFCRPCLQSDILQSFHQAYREHIHRGDTKRIFPIPIKNGAINNGELEKLSPNNQMMSRWFYGKCLMESSWCS